MDKLFTIAGVAHVNGVATYRFATGNVKVREGVLRRAGFEPVDLRALPSEMTRDQAIAWLGDQGITAIIPVKNKVAGRPTKSTEARAARKTAAPIPAETPLSDADEAFLAEQAAAAEQGADAALAAADAAPEMTFAQRMAAARAAKRAREEQELGVDGERELSGVEC